jgi:DNA-binding NarL/FixJ family response regulator
MPVSSDDSTILIVDPLPLRTLGLVSLFDRLSKGKRFRVASLTPADAERFIDSDRHCRMIIYNLGGGSLADHKHARRIKSLRGRAADTPLVILSDSNSREEIVTALTLGAQGFLYAGTSPQLALQALSFIFDGGSYFPAAMPAKHRRAAQPDAGTAEAAQPLEWRPHAVEGGGEHGTALSELTERQKAVRERLEHGESNKSIARQLGIREGTVKVHVRQIMRKLGAANRTQVAIARANGRNDEGPIEDRSRKGR